MHYYAEKLNEIGFEHRGEPVTIVDIEEFTKTVEKTQLSRTGKIATPRKLDTRMGRIILESGDDVEMEIDTIRDMVNHAERHQYQ
jgi:hypothetical protein